MGSDAAAAGIPYDTEDDSAAAAAAAAGLQVAAAGAGTSPPLLAIESAGSGAEGPSVAGSTAAGPPPPEPEAADTDALLPGVAAAAAMTCSAREPAVPEPFPLSPAADGSGAATAAAPTAGNADDGTQRRASVLGHDPRRDVLLQYSRRRSRRADEHRGGSPAANGAGDLRDGKREAADALDADARDAGCTASPAAVSHAKGGSGAPHGAVASTLAQAGLRATGRSLQPQATAPTSASTVPVSSPATQPLEAAAAQPELRVTQDGSVVLIEDVLEDDGPGGSSMEAGVPVPAVVLPASPGFSLSPAAAPFFPGCWAGGCSKQSRWWDDDDEDFNDNPTSYLDVILRPAKPTAASPLCAQTCRAAGRAHGGVDTGRHGRRRHRRPCPQLVHGLPARPPDSRTPDSRIPAHCRLGRRGRVSAPNSDWWREILTQQEARPVAASAEPRQKQLPQARRIPEALHGRCFNCLSYSHRVATCRLPRRCLRCHGLHHLARECKRPQPMPSTAKGGGSARIVSPPASLHTPHGSPSSSEAAVQVGAARVRRRRRRRRCTSAVDVTMSAPLNPTDDTAATLLSAAPDPLVTSDPCAEVEPLAWVDPMLEEFAASHVLASRAPAAGCPPPAPPAASVEVDTSLAIALSSAKVARETEVELPDLATLSEEEEAEDAEDADACASFCERMFRKVPKPLLPRPPASPPAVKKQSRTRGAGRSLAPTRSNLRQAARPSSVLVAQRAQLKLMRELDFINSEPSAPDAAATEHIDSLGFPEEAIKAIRTAVKLDNKELGEALAAIAAGLGTDLMEVP